MPVQFDLVSPERRLASLKATEVQIPGADGDMTAMEGHSPTVTTLRPGILRVTGSEGTQSFAVTGGFAEVTAQAVTVLAERAVPLAEVTAAMADAMVADARDAAAKAPAETRDAAEKYAADIAALKAAVSPH